MIITCKNINSTRKVLKFSGMFKGEKTQKEINWKDVYVVGPGSSGSDLFVGSGRRSDGFFFSTEGAKVLNALSDINLLKNILVHKLRSL